MCVFLCSVQVVVWCFLCAGSGPNDNLVESCRNNGGVPLKVISRWLLSREIVVYCEDNYIGAESREKTEQDNLSAVLNLKIIEPGSKNVPK